jgi:hypothetical protein
MPLTGDQVRRLHEAIVSDFSRPEMERLVRFGLAERLDEISPEGPLDMVVLELIQWAERQGRTEDLIQAVRRALPNNQMIQAIAEELLNADERSLGRPGSRSLSQRADRSRSAMIEKVRAIWITGILRKSLFREVHILLSLSERSHAVLSPFHQLVRRPNEGDRPLPAGTQIVDVFDMMDQALLILGAPGAGKTTIMLELARDLLDRAEREPEHPIPVVFPLSTWEASRKPLAEWLADELNLRYDVPRKIAQEWVAADQILPLLDGLDTIRPKQRASCVETFNSFRQSHGLLPVAVTCRTDAYESPKVKLRLHGAVVLRPLTPTQVDSYLAEVGHVGVDIRRTIQNEPTLRDLMNTPLMLQQTIRWYSRYKELAPNEQGKIREILLRLIQLYVGNTGEEIQQFVRMEKLLSTSDDRDIIEELIKLLVASGLVVRRSSRWARREEVGLSQDVPLQVWAWLRKWLDQNRPLFPPASQRPDRTEGIQSGTATFTEEGIQSGTATFTEEEIQSGTATFTEVVAAVLHHLTLNLPENLDLT